MVDDPRDDELAARLAVEPLDELTRRRLVARAMSESEVDAAPASPTGPSVRRLRWLVAAAAALLVVVLGSVAILRNNGSNDATVASRDRTRVVTGSTVDPQQKGAAAPNAEAAAGSSADSAFGSTGIALGDFGDLSKAAARTRVLAAIDAANLQSPSGITEGIDRSACRDPDSDPVLATATGTYAGRPARVLVTEAGEGRRVLLLISDPCEVRQLR
ncbi:MAG: hypothetical protein ABW211_03080 [Acidimicrobiia bacterium]